MYESKAWLGQMVVAHKLQGDCQPGSLTYIKGHTRAIAFFTMVMWHLECKIALPEWILQMAQNAPVLVVEATNQQIQAVEALVKNVRSTVLTRSMTCLNMVHMMWELNMDIQTFKDWFLWFLLWLVLWSSVNPVYVTFDHFAVPQNLRSRALIQ